MHIPGKINDERVSFIRRLGTCYSYSYSTRIPGICLHVNNHRSPRWCNRVPSFLLLVTYVSSSPPECILVYVYKFVLVDFFLCIVHELTHGNRETVSY